MSAIVVFVSTTYSLALVLSVVVGLTGGHESAIARAVYFSSTFLPAAAVLIATKTLNEGPRIQWDKFPLRYLPVALFLIPGVLHVVTLPLLVALEGHIPWQDWLKPQADGLYHTPLSRGWGVLTVEGLASRIVVNAVVGLLIVSAFTFFEEIGWRAWLLPRLRDRLGSRAAVVVTAIIWALWHVPFQLSGVQHIDGVSPVRLALTLPAGIMIAGLILGWLWLRTESIWLVSIAHGALNSWGQYAFKYMKDSGSVAKDAEALAGGFLVLLAVAVLLLWYSVPADASPSIDVAAGP